LLFGKTKPAQSEDWHCQSLLCAGFLLWRAPKKIFKSEKSKSDKLVFE
jgi:hypothetical protein